MKRILVFASHWPPRGGIPAYRIVKMSKVLLESDFDVTVITPKDTPDVALEDFSLADELTNITIHRVPPSKPCLRLGGRILNRIRTIPDAFAPWIHTSILKARLLHERTPFAAILTSAPPYSFLEIGRRLSREWRVPWISDIRDLWAENPFHAGKHPVVRLLETHWEKRRLPAASATITATRGIASYLEHRRNVSSPLFVPTGYDRDDFVRSPAPPRNDNIFTIVHAGGLHEYRDVSPLLDAFARLPSKYRFLQIGPVSGNNEKRLKNHDSRNPGRLVFIPGLPFKEMVEHLHTADLLLLYETTPTPVGDMIRGKIFPYLGARRPILAVSPPCEMTRIVLETGAGRVIWPAEGDTIARAVRKVVSPNWNEAAWERYEIRNTMKPLLERIWSLLKEE